jgi:hypothetical protein
MEKEHSKNRPFFPTSLDGTEGFFIAWLLVAAGGPLSGLLVSLIGFFFLQDSGQMGLLEYMLPIVLVFSSIHILAYPVIRAAISVVKALSRPASA